MASNEMLADWNKYWVDSHSIYQHINILTFMITRNTAQGLKSKDGGILME